MTRSIRRLLSTPSFTLPAIGALALAIAATTAVFSVVHATMLQSIGFADTDRITAIWATDPARGQKQVETCYRELLDWQKQTDIFSHVALASSVNLDYPLLGDGQSQQIDGAIVSGAFFHVLGTSPAAGRLLDANDDQPNAEPHIVISHRLWQSRYGADPKIAGRQIRIGPGTATIVGVTPPQFDFPRDVDVWIPLRVSWPTVEQQPRFRVFRTIGKLKPGVSHEQAEARPNSLPRDKESYPSTVTPILDEIYGPARKAIWMLMGAVVLVLLIACGNVANLLLARATSRRDEFAIRGALGAGRWRLVKLVLEESLLLCSAASILGLGLGWAAIRALAAFAPPEVPRVDAASMNVPVLLFGLAISFATVLLFGLAPSVIASNEALKLGRGQSSDRAQNRLRSLLVISEIALSVVLLVGATLLVRSFQALSSVDPGFRADHILTFRVTTNLPQQEQRKQRYTAILDRLRSLPEVESAAAVLLRPLSGLVGWDGVYAVEGQSAEDQKRNPNINYEAISPEYFKTMGIRILAGEDFTGKEQASVIINESTAKRHWPNQSAIGQRVKVNNQWLTVAAVVADVRYREWEAVRPDFYVPYTQRAQHRTDFVVKTRTDPAAVANAVRLAVFAVDKDQPISQLTTMARLVDRALSRSRFIGLVLSSLAVSAVVLAVIGIYGVLAYSVAQRKMEIGIRMAIGATPSGILNHFIQAGVRLAMAGSIVGLALAFISSRFVGSLLYGVRPLDATSYVGACTVILLLTLLASAHPAWRASQSQPSRILQ